MPKNLYITGLEAQSGKTLAALAFMHHLSQLVEKVSVFRPIVLENPESDIVSSTAGSFSGNRQWLTIT